jgi:hypothetical protein
MSQQNHGGEGIAFDARRTAALRADIGPTFPGLLDLNEAGMDEMADHPLIGEALAVAIRGLRDGGRIETPEQLLHAGVIEPRLLPALQQFTFGSTPLRPLLSDVALTEGPCAYVGEATSLRLSWVRSPVAEPEILSLHVRFPSGRCSTADLRLSPEQVEAGSMEVAGLVSGESGELYVLATLRDSRGHVSQRSTRIDVFTRNPVQIFVTPTHFSQSGSAGAPRFNFAESRWECEAAVRWVNGEPTTVNLGRRVNVRATDAALGEVANFSFDLSSDIVIPANSTVFGSWMTWHAGGAIFDEFSAKGDLTFHYTMSGSGFSPTRSQVWRSMRTVGYNIIRVGDFTANERAEYVRAAREVASDIFRSRDMTVEGVELFRIEGTPDMDADKARWRFIDNDGEFDAMATKYSVQNVFMDVFQVEGYHGGFGASYVNAPVDKNGSRSGIVIRRDSDTVNLGQTYAHEAGHHLGLEHADADDGCADTDPASPTISDNFIFSSSRRDSRVITGCQINTMRKHGFVRWMSP